MKKFVKINVLKLALPIFFILGCQAKEEEFTREKTLSVGFELMDREQYDEAISYFQDLYARDSHYQVKIALASAFAGRGGVKVAQLYSVIRIQSLSLPEISLKDLSQREGQVNVVLEALQRIFSQWDALAEVNALERADLYSAIRVMEGELNQGVRIYSAMLKIIALKSSLKEGVANYQSRLAKRRCVQDTQDFLKWTLKVFAGLSQVAMDLEISFPENKAQYSEVRLGLETLIDSVSKVSVKGEPCR